MVLETGMGFRGLARVLSLSHTLLVSIAHTAPNIWKVARQLTVKSVKKEVGPNIASIATSYASTC
jgi:hypothetical protein